MLNIVLGFLLTGMTFNFLGLQYILPTLGAGLLYIGFHDLRKENKALNIGWIFSIVNIVLNALNLIYISTPLSVNFKENGVIIFILTVFQLAFLLVFREGIKKVFEKGDERPARDPILWAVIWRVIIIICAITKLGSVWFISIPLIFFYFYIYRSIYILCYDLRETIYKPSELNKKVSDKKFVLGYMICCTFLVAICCVGANHIRLDSTVFNPPGTSEIRDILIDNGFPKDIIMDISDDEVEMLQDAIHIESSSELLSFDERKETVKSDYGINSTELKPGKINLEATTIYAELKDNRMYAIEYYQWQGGGAYWNDGFTISNSDSIELINGRLLYDKKGISYCAPIPRLKKDMVKESDWFENTSQIKKFTGGINYPFGSERQRGYVFYRVDIREDVTIGSNIFNYMHYRVPFRVPYTEPEHNALMFNDSLRQHATNFRTKASMEAIE